LRYAVVGVFIKNIMRKNYLWCVVLSISCYGVLGQSQTRLVDNTIHHLRNGAVREWSEFPEVVTDKQLKLDFLFKGKPTEATMIVRQYDVKQDWDVLLNDQKVGSLVTDEQDMVVFFAVPSGLLKRGRNELVIKCTSESVDDIKVGRFALDMRSLDQVLSESSLEIQVLDRSSGNVLPSRITITNYDGSLQSVAASKQKNLAIRPGVIYTSNGTASFRLPAGKYKVYATRGFEYGVDSVEVVLKPGDKVEKSLRIAREVDTNGWISSDTHIHTFTYSRHGDASMEERAITIAGEGIELPILTDHNVHVDIEPFAQMMEVDHYFTPVVGNELTTKVGHFNIFQMTPGNRVIDPNAEDWNSIGKNINDKANVKAVILNHARDIHNGFRPFGPEHHLSSAGTSLDMNVFPANSMEVMNSGSQQTHIMNLFHDWFGMINRGYHLTPVGSSDSHDVSRYIVGQGRTYIKGNDNDPANINVDSAIRNFKKGKVLVSAGLLSKIKVNDQYGPGDMAPPSEKISVTVEVWGPAWTKADHVSLYANGKKIKEEKIEDDGRPGLKWQNTWEINLPGHDVFLVAIAGGPGEGMPFWPIAKPYQPASTEWTPRLVGSTGPVWIDADNNGVRNTAFYYAATVMDESEGSMEKVMEILRGYDRAVAMQVAMLLWTHGKDLASEEVTNALKGAADETTFGFEQVMREIEGIGNKE
jgi:hypothetical protein